MVRDVNRTWGGLRSQMESAGDGDARFEPICILIWAVLLARIWMMMSCMRGGCSTACFQPVFRPHAQEEVP